MANKLKAMSGANLVFGSKPMQRQTIQNWNDTIKDRPLFDSHYNGTPVDEGIYGLVLYGRPAQIHRGLAHLHAEAYSLDVSMTLTNVIRPNLYSSATVGFECKTGIFSLAALHELRIDGFSDLTEDEKHIVKTLLRLVNMTFYGAADTHGRIVHPLLGFDLFASPASLMVYCIGNQIPFSVDD